MLLPLLRRNMLNRQTSLRRETHGQNAIALIMHPSRNPTKKKHLPRPGYAVIHVRLSEVQDDLVVGRPPIRPRRSLKLPDQALVDLASWRIPYRLYIPERDIVESRVSRLDRDSPHQIAVHDSECSVEVIAMPHTVMKHHEERNQ